MTTDSLVGVILKNKMKLQKKKNTEEHLSSLGNIMLTEMLILELMKSNQ